MLDKNIQTILNQLKEADSAIKDAEAEVRMRQKRLGELVPKKKSIEEECAEQFGCKPAELPALQKEKAKTVEVEAAKLIKEMAEVNTTNE